MAKPSPGQRPSAFCLFSLVCLFATASAQAQVSPEAGAGGSGDEDQPTQGAPNAEGSPPTAAQAAEARRLFGRGVSLSREERWGEALTYFRQSAESAPRPSTTFNIALALLRLGEPIEARTMLTRYLVQSEGLGREADRRSQAAELMALAESSIAVLTLDLAPANAEVRVDGVLAEGTATPRILSLDPGVHVIRGTLEGYAANSLEVSLLEGGQVRESLTLAARTDPARIRVTANVQDAVIRIDDMEVGRGTYSGELAPGTHQVEVRAEGYEPYTRDLDVAALERLNVTASLSRVESGGIWKSPWLWVAVGAVLVGAGVGVGVGVASSGTAPAYGGNTGVVLQGLRLP